MRNPRVAFIVGPVNPRTIAVAAAVIALAAMAATGALSGTSPPGRTSCTPAAGAWTGKTAQDRKISFRVAYATTPGTCGSLRRGSFPISATCPDGFVDTTHALIEGRGWFPLDAFARGAWQLNATGGYTGADGFTVREALHGSFTASRRATGFVTATVDRSDHGGLCKSGKVGWNARH